MQECVQMHGGIGVTWDHDIHLYLRRVTTNRAILGAPRGAPLGHCRPSEAVRMAGVETLEDFRQRSRAWLADNMRRLPPDAEPWNAMCVDEGDAERAKELQRSLFEAASPACASQRSTGARDYRGITRRRSRRNPAPMRCRCCSTRPP